MEKANTLEEVIYALEPLCYYFGMKPHEFWNATYREVQVFCKANSSRITDNLKSEINVQEASTDKIILSNPLLYSRPKIQRLTDMFSNLFKKKEKEQTIEEQIKIFRG